MGGLLQKVNIHFRGVCTHFCGIVPGVPHRVVLPDAWDVTGGFFEVDAAPSHYEYLLMPHIPVVYTDYWDEQVIEIVAQMEEQSFLSIPNVMLNGLLLGGVHLRIANAVDEVVEYAPSFKKFTPPLVDYVPTFDYSTEVVVGGRASAYLDINGGLLSVEPLVSERKSLLHRTMITITTIGPPVLAVTPMFLEDSHGESSKDVVDESTRRTPSTSFFPLMTNDIFVGNVDVTPFNFGFDFLYHFVTMRGGIPRRFKAFPPGFDQHPEESPLKSAKRGSLDELARTRMNLHALGRAGDFAALSSLLLKSAGPAITTLACSDSRYP